MAVYHCAIRTLSRGQGRNAVQAAGYRSGARVRCARTGRLFDYTRKGGVMATRIVVPQGGTTVERQAVWDAVEAAEKRCNSTVAREVEIALPHELSPEARLALAMRLARRLAVRYRILVDVAVHAPGEGGDTRNVHAHLLMTTREWRSDGTLGAKVRCLDDRATGPHEVLAIRSLWAELTNEALVAAGLADRVDHRSHADRGLATMPGRKLGVGATGVERRTGAPSRRRLDHDADAIALAEARHTIGTEVAPSRSTTTLDGLEVARVNRVDPIQNVLRAQRARFESATSISMVGRPSEAVDAALTSVIATTAEALLNACASLAEQKGLDGSRSDVAGPDHGAAPPEVHSRSATRPAAPDPVLCDASVVQEKAGTAAVPDHAPANPNTDRERASVNSPPVSRNGFGLHNANLRGAVALFTILRRERRLSAARVETLAATVGMDRPAFEAVATVAAPGTPVTQDAAKTMLALPLTLALLRDRWTDEDSAARRTRRAQARVGITMVDVVPTPDLASAADDMTGGDRRSARSMRGGDEVRAPSPDPRAVGGDSAPVFRRDEPATEPAPLTSPDQPSGDQPTGRAGDKAPPGSTALDRAMYLVFAAAVRDAARRRGGAIPTPAATERGVAVRLRAAGRDRGEVLAVLTAGTASNPPDGRQERVTQAVNYAFAENTTAWLRERPRFADHARALQIRAEAGFYRALRRRIMTELKRDLDAVWAERRLRAEEAARRHARRLALLQELRWRTRRMGKRNGLALAILSALVELAVLRPLIARQHVSDAAEHAAINAAAARASADLKRARQDWRAYAGGQDAHAAEDGKGEERRPPERPGPAGGRGGQTDGRDAGTVTASDDSDAALRRQVVAGLGMAMVARGEWSDGHARRLARLAGVDRAGLWSAVCDVCRQRYGHARPSALGVDKTAEHWKEAWREASRLGWADMLRLMRELAAGRGMGGKGDGQER